MHRHIKPLVPRILVALTAAAVAASGGCAASDDSAAGPRPSASSIRAGVPLGVVLGGIYRDVPQSLATDGDRIFCELSALGAQWVRVQAGWYGWSGDDAGMYRDVVRRAHAHGLRVVVLVTDDYCGGDDDLAGIDRFVEGFQQRVRLATQVFAGDAAPDAYELVNEPNNNGACPDGHSFRVSGNAFAWLLRRVWDARGSLGVNAPIVSGGVLNAYHDAPTEQAWWGAFFGSGAWSVGERPFDYMGIHPYDGWSYDGGGDFGGWREDTRARLASLAARVDAVSGASGTRLFVTEFGWAHGGGRGYRAGDNVLESDDAVAAGLAAAVGAFEDSGVVSAAIWYDYRDDWPAGPGSQYYGLRGAWTGADYAVKSPVRDTFADLAGGDAGASDACWSAGASASASDGTSASAPGCPCRGDVDNYCGYAPGTPGCAMTAPGGYCDPDGDGSYADADWARGWSEFHAACP